MSVLLAYSEVFQYQTMLTGNILPLCWRCGQRGHERGVCDSERRVTRGGRKHRKRTQDPVSSPESSTLPEPVKLVYMDGVLTIV